jgi:hypothetical protein
LESKTKESDIENMINQFQALVTSVTPDKLDEIQERKVFSDITKLLQQVKSKISNNSISELLKIVGILCDTNSETSLHVQLHNTFDKAKIDELRTSIEKETSKFFNLINFF